MPLLSYVLSIILIQKTGYNFTVLVYALMSLASGSVYLIPAKGELPTKWQLFISEQLAGWVSNGISIFIIFWALNFKEFGGTNGVLGVVYLAGMYNIFGVANWVWNKWEPLFIKWWLELLGGND